MISEDSNLTDAARRLYEGWLRGEVEDDAPPVPVCAVAAAGPDGPYVLYAVKGIEDCASLWQGVDNAAELFKQGVTLLGYCGWKLYEWGGFHLSTPDDYHVVIAAFVGPNPYAERRPDLHDKPLPWPEVIAGLNESLPMFGRQNADELIAGLVLSEASSPMYPMATIID